MQTLDRYQLESLIGEGGFGAVYRAKHIHTRQVVALKVLRNAAANGIDAQNLVREAQIIASIRHPNIVQVYDAGISEGVAFFAMELVHGASLGDILQTRGPMPWHHAHSFAMQLLAGLGAAHRAGAVHRDVKPQNLLVADDGTLKILDFGISKTTRARPGNTLSSRTLTGHGWMGTPGYMAPEQYRGTVDARADIYAAAATLFVMLTGRLPYLADTVEALYTQAMQTRAPLVSQVVPSVPEHVVVAIDRALARDPDARFATAEAFQVALTQGTTSELAAPITVARAPLGNHVVPSTGATTFYATQQTQAKGPPRVVWGGLLGGAAILLALGYGTWRIMRPSDETRGSGGTVVESGKTIVRRGKFTETQYCRYAETIRYEDAEIFVSGVGIEISHACDLSLVNTKIEAQVGISGDTGDVIIQGGSIVAQDTAIRVQNSTTLNFTNTRIQGNQGLKLGGPAKLSLQDTTITSTQTGIESAVLTELSITRGEIRASTPIVVRGTGKVTIASATIVGKEAALDLDPSVERTITGGTLQGEVRGGSGPLVGAPEKVRSTTSTP